MSFSVVLASLQGPVPSVVLIALVLFLVAVYDARATRKLSGSDARNTPSS